MQKNDYQKKRKKALPEYISIISSDNCAKIKIEEIEILEQDGRKIHLVTERKDFTFYGGFNTIAELLAERAFYRPIKSIIINLDQITDISGYSINFRSGQTLTLGKNALANTRKAYKRYLQRYPPYTVWEPIMVAEEVEDENNEYVGKSGTSDTN